MTQDAPQTPVRRPTRGRRPADTKGDTRGDPPASRWDQLLRDPRNAVLFVLGSVLILGGGRRLWQAWAARGAVARLAEGGPPPSPSEVEAASAYGRSALMELFRLLGSGEADEVRKAAGRALAKLWAADEMIPEEEKALIRRGVAVTWTARRRYPRALRGEIPIHVSFGVPFLTEGGPGVSPSNLEWSYRTTGTRRASLESYSPWSASTAALLPLVRADFDTNGPHQLVLQARVRTVGLTSAWELELPHTPFTFEFDPDLRPESLMTLPDDARAEIFARQIGLSFGPEDDASETFYPLNDTLVLRHPPCLSVLGPIPCDLAHAVSLEIEGVPGQHPAGAIVVTQDDHATWPRLRPLGPITPIPVQHLDRPGRYRMRARLTADPDLGWANPAVRSLWPGTIETPWFDVDVIRR